MEHARGQKGKPGIAQNTRVAPFPFCFTFSFSFSFTFAFALYGIVVPVGAFTAPGAISFVEIGSAIACSASFLNFFSGRCPSGRIFDCILISLFLFFEKEVLNNC